MSERRIQRLNSLLKEVLSDVINKEIRDPRLPKFITVTQVDISKDLQHAKVFITVLGEEKKKKEAVTLLQAAAGHIALHASKQVDIRYFPHLTFLSDDSLEKQIKIEGLISEIQAERKGRNIDGKVS